MGLKKVSYSLPNLKSLVESPSSCVSCIENCSRSLTVIPAHLDNIKHSVKELLNAKVTTYDPILKGIILGHRNIKVVNHLQLNDDGNFSLDYVADIFIFKPEVGNILSGEVNKKSKDHIAVLIHSYFNACIPRPRNDNECPKTWNGFDVSMGHSVTFEVVKVNLSGRLPFIKGKLIDVGENDNEDKDSGIGGHDSMEESTANRDILEKFTKCSDSIVKKKKKKKKKADSLIVDQEEEVDNNIDRKPEETDSDKLIDALMAEAELQSNNCSFEKKKKKNKKKELLNRESIETESEFCNPPSDSNIETIKKHKKKKRKHSESQMFSTMESTSNLPTEEVMDIEPPKPRQSIETESEFCNPPSDSNIETIKKHKKKKRKHSESEMFSTMESTSNLPTEEVMDIEPPKKKKKKKSQTNEISYCQAEV